MPRWTPESKQRERVTRLKLGPRLGRTRERADRVFAPAKTPRATGASSDAIKGGYNS